MQTLTNTEEGFDESDAHLLINKTCPTIKLSHRRPRQRGWLLAAAPGSVFLVLNIFPEILAAKGG